MRIVMVGFGKIARDKHIGAIAASQGIELVAIVSDHAKNTPQGVPLFRSLEEYYASGITADAATHCNTPAARFASAASTIAHGLDTLVEKPPFASLEQCAEIAKLAKGLGTVLSTSWHAQHNNAVDRARDWLADKHVFDIEMRWIENARKWHPGQTWLWEPGGFGVFDPGMNGLSILTQVLPAKLRVASARFEIPGNCAMPIAAQLEFSGEGDALKGQALLDFRGGDTEQWDIRVRCEQGELVLRKGGRILEIDGDQVLANEDSEYDNIYAAFRAAALKRESVLDFEPLRLVAEAFALAEKVTVEDFHP